MDFGKLQTIIEKKVLTEYRNGNLNFKAVPVDASQIDAYAGGLYRAFDYSLENDSVQPGLSFGISCRKI